MSRSLKPVLTVSAAGRPFDNVRDEFTGLVMTGEAVICPCCDRHNMICKRKITSTMAKQLYAMRQEAWRYHFSKELQKEVGGEWRMYSLLRFWSFVEAGKDGGLWRITKSGIAFVDGRIDAPRCALVLNDRCIGFVPDQRITFKEASKDEFDLPEVFSVTVEDLM